MNTKKSFVALLGLILLMNFGCDDNENGSGSNVNERNAKLKRSLLYPSLYVVNEYEYDTQGRISKVSTPLYENGNIVGTAEYDAYEYNSSGELISISNFINNSNEPSGYLNFKNIIYTYSPTGLKTKELIEYPLISSFAYTLYSYSDNQLVRADRYNHEDELENYRTYEYSANNLVKEILYLPNDEVLELTSYRYTDNLNTETEIYRGSNGEDKLREIKKTYDSNDNLIMLESTEVAVWSSAASYVMKYEYYQQL